MTSRKTRETWRREQTQQRQTVIRTALESSIADLDERELDEILAAARATGGIGLRELADGCLVCSPSLVIRSCCPDVSAAASRPLTFHGSAPVAGFVRPAGPRATSMIARAAGERTLVLLLAGLKVGSATPATAMILPESRPAPDASATGPSSPVSATVAPSIPAVGPRPSAPTPAANGSAESSSSAATGPSASTATAAITGPARAADAATGFGSCPAAAGTASPTSAKAAIPPGPLPPAASAAVTVLGIATTPASGAARAVRPASHGPARAAAAPVQSTRFSRSDRSATAATSRCTITLATARAVERCAS